MVLTVTSPLNYAFLDYPITANSKGLFCYMEPLREVFK